MLFSQTSINPSYVKVRWQEPYTSAALNNKSFGVYPPGIYSGFTINPGGLSTRDIVVGYGSVSGNVGTGLNSGYLSGNFDATVGFSVAVIQDPTGFQETVSLPPTAPQYHLDATGQDGKHLFIVLTTNYAIGNATTASVALVDGPYIDANPWVIVIGFVDIPSNPITPLNATMFGYNDPVYPRLTPLATPNKAGLMPPGVFSQIGQNASPWEQNLLVMNVDQNNPFVVTITPSQYVVTGRRIYSYVQASVASKFPRNAQGRYNGGINNDQLTRMNLLTGTIGGAQQVSGNSTFPVPSVSGTPNSWQVGLVSLDPADNLLVIYGGFYSSVTGATLDDNLPVAGASLLQIGAFVVGTDVSGHFLPLLQSVSGGVSGGGYVSGYGPILWRRPYLNVGGGGSGNANELLTRLQERLVLSTFQNLSDNIFTQTATSKVATATATFDVANNVYTFTNIGQTVVSTQCLSSDFLALGTDVDTVEVMDFWSVIDPAHLVEVSRDGGFSYQAVTMTQIGTTETFRGIHQFTNESSFATLLSASVSGTPLVLNASTTQARAQSILISAVDVVTQAAIGLTKTGSPSGTFRVRLVKDSAGSPSTSVLDILSESEAITLASLPSGSSYQTYTLPNVTVQPGNYWLEIVPDVNYIASFSAGVTQLVVQGNNPGSTSSASFNGTSWTVVGNVEWKYQLNGKVLDLRVRVTSGSQNVKLQGYGIFYGLIPGVSTGKKNIEIQSFSGDDNLNQFTLTQFVPNADFLKVYFPGTGQVFTFGDFSLDGLVVNFPPNTFNLPGDTLTLKFDQTEGQGFDNSDTNAALLTDNHLGSTNPNYDRSLPGRGILLRRPDGVLRELSLDNLDQVVISSTP